MSRASTGLLRIYALAMGAMGFLLVGLGAFSSPALLPPVALGGAYLTSALLLWLRPLIGWMVAMLVLAAQIVWPIWWVVEMVGSFRGLEGFGKLGVVVFTTLLVCVVVVSAAALVVLGAAFPRRNRA